MTEKTRNLTRKIQIIPVGDKEEFNRVYKYIREGMTAQNKAMNEYMSALYIAQVQEISKDDRKELNHLYSRIATSKKGSAYSKDIEFAKGLPSTSSVKQKVQQDFSTAMKKGLMYGRISLPTYRDDNPLLVHVDYVRLRSTNPHIDNGMYHNYASHTEFLEHLYKNDCEIFIKFANGITFQLVLGSVRNSIALRSEIQQIFEGNYEIGGSSIQFKDKKIILNLCLSMPVEETELDENVVVGVDIGCAVPAVCALNTNKYERKFIGCADDFIRVRTQMQNQRRRLQYSLRASQGGHGRDKKLKALDRLKAREKHFAETYNHYVSRQIVDFAVKNKAKYINIEDLEGIKTNNFILRNWSYYQLQTYITYKAKAYGITVRKVNPYHTSQVCSVCGHWEEGQRIDQAHFKCKRCGAELNADFNAARNIAMSTDFQDSKKTKTNKKDTEESDKQLTA